jgi:hypothetical protein
VCTHFGLAGKKTNVATTSASTAQNETNAHNVPKKPFDRLVQLEIQKMQLKIDALRTPNHPDKENREPEKAKLKLQKAQVKLEREKCKLERDKVKLDIDRCLLHKVQLEVMLLEQQVTLQPVLSLTVDKN